MNQSRKVIKVNIGYSEFTSFGESPLRMKTQGFSGNYFGVYGPTYKLSAGLKFQSFSGVLFTNCLNIYPLALDADKSLP